MVLKAISNEMRRPASAVCAVALALSCVGWSVGCGDDEMNPAGPEAGTGTPPANPPAPGAEPPTPPANPPAPGAEPPAPPAAPPPTPTPPTPTPPGGQPPPSMAWEPTGGLDMLSSEPTLPPVGDVADYGLGGPFQTVVIESTGPDGAYFMYRPVDEELGYNGFQHPIATWGNGVLTEPPAYNALLRAIASHGFVVIASESRRVSPALMTAGLDWLIEQNDGTGELGGVLDTTRAVSIGYSLGGRGAVNAGTHPSVVAVVSMHGAPGASQDLQSPLLLFAGELDDVVTAAGSVQPTFDRSAVQTFYTTREGADHLYPLTTARDERAPTIAWLRMWVYGDETAEAYFYGDDCLLCSDPWLNTQRKNWP